MPHLDAETVAAFANRTLDARQRSRVFEHLVRCEACREWIAVHAELSESVGHRPWFRAASWWSVAAAAAVLVCAAPWFLRRPEPVVNAVRVARPARTFKFAKQEPGPNYASLPAAWQQVRLAPELFPASPDGQLVLKTVVGEKWIPLDGLLGSVVP